MTDFSAHMPKRLALFDTIVDASAEGMKRARLERVDAELIEGREEYYEEHGEVEKKVFTKPVANPLCDPEIRKQLASPDAIAKMTFTCGEKNAHGEGIIIVTIKPLCYHKNTALWAVTYESDYSGVSPAFLVHCEPEMYGMDYNVLCVDDLDTQTPSSDMALFEDLTQAMVIGMRPEVIEEYAKCAKSDIEYLRERGAEEAYLDAIS